MTLRQHYVTTSQQWSEIFPRGAVMLFALAGEVGDKYGTEQVDLKHLIYIAAALLVGTAAVIHNINNRKDF